MLMMSVFLLGGHGDRRPPWSNAFTMISFATHVELLLPLALHVHVGRGAENVGEASAPHLVGDHFRRKRHVVENDRQLARRLRMARVLIDDEAIDGDDRGGGILTTITLLNRAESSAAA